MMPVSDLRIKEQAFRRWCIENNKLVPFNAWQEATIQQIFSAQPGDRSSRTIEVINQFLNHYPPTTRNR